jgi:hypothetical protein
MTTYIENYSNSDGIDDEQFLTPEEQEKMK